MVLTSSGSVATSPDMLAPQLGGPYSTTLMKLENHIETVKTHVPERIIKAFLGLRSRNHMGLSQALIDDNTDRLRLFKEYWAFPINQWREAILGVEKGLRYKQYRLLCMRIFETRSNVLEMLVKNTWPLHQDVVTTIMYPMLAECVTEASPGRVIQVVGESGMDGVGNVILRPSRQSSQELKPITNILKAQLLRQASFETKFELEPTSNPYSPSMKLHWRIAWCAFRIRYLELNLTVMSTLSGTVDAGVYYPTKLYAFQDSLFYVISREMPALRTLHLTIDDSEIGLHEIQNRWKTGKATTEDMMHELYLLLDNLGHLQMQEGGKVYYRFVKVDASEVRQVRSDSVLGLRRDLLCAEEGVWHVADWGHLSYEMVVENGQKAYAKRGEEWWGSYAEWFMRAEEAQ
ncbi:hypothetical protein LTR08_002435 [Meristemomyces frigidus]|nr:hypothetical protein LTR08_002435 [Meristemomyces frigidus]